jgi:predicted proteasome-type protease
LNSSQSSPNKILNNNRKGDVKMTKPRTTSEVWVSVGLTVNLGNYESARFDAGMTVPLEDSETYEDGFKKAWDTTFTEIEEQTKDFKGVK